MMGTGMKTWMVSDMLVAIDGVLIMLICDVFVCD
jgi:hypothetical protein